jgi:hypothetical protein
MNYDSSPCVNTTLLFYANALLHCSNCVDFCTFFFLALNLLGVFLFLYLDCASCAFKELTYQRKKKLSI